MDRPKQVVIDVSDRTWEEMQEQWAKRPPHLLTSEPNWQALFKAALSLAVAVTEVQP